MGNSFLTAISRYLHENRTKIAKGTIVEATIISVLSSSTNKDGKRDCEMYQTTKCTRWYFGMKARVAVDSRPKLIHAILAPAANLTDRDALPRLLHGKETRDWCDQARRGQQAVTRKVAWRAKDFTNQCYRWGSRFDERIHV